MANAINWFEIPASNFERACGFYGQVLGADIPQQDMAGTMMGFLPATEQDVGGAVIFGEGYEPSAQGSIVYLNGGNDLSEPLSRVEGAGGSVVVPKTKISDAIGSFAMFMDTEGNRLAFHSPH